MEKVVNVKKSKVMGRVNNVFLKDKGFSCGRGNIFKEIAHNMGLETLVTAVLR